MDSLAPTRPRRAPCAPWCTDHHTGAHPDDDHCRRPAPGLFAHVYLSDDPDGRPVILSHRRVRDEQTPADARAYALALLELADAAQEVAA